jgi:hypothetical protein
MARQFRIFYLDEGQHLRGVLCVRTATGFRRTGVEERVSLAIAQAAIAEYEGRPELHPSELGFTELGAGAFRRKVVTVAKKAARSKLLKAAVQIGKIGVSFVPGGGAAMAASQGLRTAVKAGKTAVQAGRAIRQARTATLSGAPPAAVAAARARVPAAAASKAAQILRAKVAPTSKVAKTTPAAMLRETRLAAASKALALVPAAKQADAAKTIAARVDGYKVLTPSGNTIWVAKSAIGA